MVCFALHNIVNEVYQFSKIPVSRSALMICCLEPGRISIGMIVDLPRRFALV